MDLRSHAVMAGYIYDNFMNKTGLRLRRLYFKIGNLLPDLLPNLRIRLHEKHKSYNFLLHKINRLYGVKNWESAFLSMKLGIVTHLITDYFCHTHTQNYNGGLAGHRRYEKALAQYIRQGLSEEHLIEGLMKVPNLASEIIDYHFEMYNEEVQSFFHDTAYAVSTACRIVENIYYISLPGTRERHAEAA